MEFQRARSDEQRTVRRRQILDTAAAMLTEMPVAQLTLNELSRRAGLAKSNVLRYFESREAILLDLLDAELQDYVTALEPMLTPIEGTPRQRGDHLAAVLAASLADRPVLCDLNSAQAAVLDRNVSTEVALHYKRATRRAIETQIELIRRCLPELSVPAAAHLVATVTLVTAAAWPYSQPPQALLAAYAADPAIAALRTDFTELVRENVAVTVSGLLARVSSPEGTPWGPGPW